jgi:methylmalonyl-CoA mutase N-terminal domain/subunit
VLAHETGVTNAVDPLGGSYFVETLTNQMQKEAEDYFDQIKLEGGMIAAIEDGFFRREIAASAFAYQQAVESKQAIIVGVNEFQEREEKPIELLQIDEATEREQLESLQRIKKDRSGGDVCRALDNLKRAAETRQNLMPQLVDAAHVRATVGEIMSALADVLGRYRLGSA